MGLLTWWLIGIVFLGVADGAVNKTGYHFQPAQNWMNDPNGPMYYNGVYHFFYQHNPYGAVWGNIVWAHSVSTDMVNWLSIEPALYPSKPFDVKGVWSGSATIIPNIGPAMLYTGLDGQMRQVQNIAFPANLSDPYLRVWVKPDYNPVVEPTPTMNATNFRDPSTAWYDGGHWKMLVGGREHRHPRGLAYLYRSRDFKRWTKAKHPLHSAPDTGMWECPDFYKVSPVEPSSNATKYVLKITLAEKRFDYYTVGAYDRRVDKYFPDNPSLDGPNGLRFDYGNFFASKSFYDTKKSRRVVWGWANESDTVRMDKLKGWAGLQAIPRVISLDPNQKQLIQWPIEEIESLRRNQVQVINHKLGKGDILRIEPITAAQADVEAAFRLPKSLEMAEPFDPRWVNAQELCAHKGSTVEGGIGPFGFLILASPGLDEYTSVFFRVFKAHRGKYMVLMCSDASRSSLNSDPGMYKPSFGGFVDVDLEDRILTLRSLIDHSIIESFGAKGKMCITSRAYPTKAVFDAATLHVFNNGSSPVTVERLDGWSMASPGKMNQVTS